MSRIPMAASFGAKLVISAALSCAKTSAKVPMVTSGGVSGALLVGTALAQQWGLPPLPITTDLVNAVGASLKQGRYR